MKISPLLALLLAACANTGNPNLHNEANWATTHFIGAQPSQAEVNDCAAKGKSAFYAGLENTAFGNIGSGAMSGALAYESCMRRAGYTPN